MGCFVVILRGLEMFMMDEARLKYHISKGREGPLVHVAIWLLERSNWGDGIQYHLHDVVNGTSSKLKVMWRLEHTTYIQQNISQFFGFSGNSCARKLNKA